MVNRDGTPLPGGGFYIGREDADRMISEFEEETGLVAKDALDDYECCWARDYTRDEIAALDVIMILRYLDYV